MGTGDEQRVAVIVEDEVDIRHLLETVLTQAGFHVIATGNGVDGIEAVRRHDPIVTTLDVNMPGMDGFEVARRIREFSSTYIVMLTALHDEIDTLQGLEAGADDYLTKPFRPRELRARIEAMLRRPRAVAAAGDVDAAVPSTGSAAPASPVSPTSPVSPSSQGTPPPSAPMQTPLTEQRREPDATRVVTVDAPALSPMSDPITAPGAGDGAEPRVTSAPDGRGWLEHNGLWLNIETRIVSRDGVEVDLTRSEFDLLLTLLESGRRVRTKPDLVLLLRGESYVTNHFVSDADKRAIEVHLGNLRKKLGENAAAPRWIETVRGIGYRLTASEAA